MGTPIYQTTDEENELVKKNKLARAKSIKDAQNTEAFIKNPSVAIGKLRRKEDLEKNKQQVKDTRDAEIKRLDEQKEKFSVKFDAQGEPLKSSYDDADERKLAKITKRADMRALRDKERGAIREDRANQRITRLANRNNMSIEEATKHYNTRLKELGRFHKGEMKDSTSKVKPGTTSEELIKWHGEGNGQGDQFKKYVNNDKELNDEVSASLKGVDPTTSNKVDTAIGINIPNYTTSNNRGYGLNLYDN